MNALTRERLEAILARFSSLTIGVLGDLFLDRYLDIDASLTEPSIETGLDAYQVTRVRSFPGAAGTVINNLLALGIAWIVPIAVIGDDGEGYELIRALKASHPNVRTMLVSNYADAQAAAVAAGALEGFGKSEIGSSKMKERLAAAI